MKKFAIVIALLAIVILGYSAVRVNLARVEDLTVEDVDLTRVTDGTYRGTYKVFPISVEVKVTVKGGVISGIQLLKHQNGQGSPASQVVDKVVDSQTLQVDVVSGATYSSKIILKAIENALTSGIR